MDRLSPDTELELLEDSDWSAIGASAPARSRPAKPRPGSRRALPAPGRARPEGEPARSAPAAVPPENELPLDDPERLGELFARLEPRLRAVALRITRNPDAARDAVQDAFEKVLRHGHRFEGQARVSTWMHRIVANEALMWLRTQRRRSRVQADVDGEALERQPAPGPCPAESASRRQHRALLERRLSALSREDRDVMLRCALAGESYADYGARTGVHPAAVKSRAFRARRRLAALLDESADAALP